MGDRKPERNGVGGLMGGQEFEGGEVGERWRHRWRRAW